MDDEAGAQVGNAFKYVMSGGFLAVAFGVLAAAPAQAKPIPMEPGGNQAPAKPSPQVKAAVKAVPGGGLAKIAESGKKLAASAKPNNDKPKGNSNQNNDKPKGNDQNKDKSNDKSSQPTQGDNGKPQQLKNNPQGRGDAGGSQGEKLAKGKDAAAAMASFGPGGVGVQLATAAGKVGEKQAQQASKRTQPVRGAEVGKSSGKNKPDGRDAAAAVASFVPGGEGVQLAVAAGKAGEKQAENVSKVRDAAFSSASLAPGGKFVRMAGEAAKVGKKAAKQEQPDDGGVGIVLQPILQATPGSEPEQELLPMMPKPKAGQGGATQSSVPAPVVKQKSFSETLNDIDDSMDVAFDSVVKWAQDTKANDDVAKVGPRPRWLDDPGYDFRLAGARAKQISAGVVGAVTDTLSLLDRMDTPEDAAAMEQSLKDGVNKVITDPGGAAKAVGDGIAATVEDIKAHPDYAAGYVLGSLVGGGGAVKAGSAALKTGSAALKTGSALEGVTDASNLISRAKAATGVAESAKDPVAAGARAVSGPGITSAPSGFASVEEAAAAAAKSAPRGGVDVLTRPVPAATGTAGRGAERVLSGGGPGGRAGGNGLAPRGGGPAYGKAVPLVAGVAGTGVIATGIGDDRDDRDAAAPSPEPEAPRARTADPGTAERRVPTLPDRNPAPDQDERPAQPIPGSGRGLDPQLAPWAVPSGPRGPGDPVPDTWDPPDPRLTPRAVPKEGNPDPGDWGVLDPELEPRGVPTQPTSPGLPAPVVQSESEDLPADEVVAPPAPVLLPSLLGPAITDIPQGGFASPVWSYGTPEPAPKPGTSQPAEPSIGDLQNGDAGAGQEPPEYLSDEDKASYRIIQEAVKKARDGDLDDIRKTIAGPRFDRFEISFDEKKYGLVRAFYGQYIEAAVAENPNVLQDANITRLGTRFKELPDFLVGNFNIDITTNSKWAEDEHLPRDYIDSVDNLIRYPSLGIPEMHRLFGEA